MIGFLLALLVAILWGVGEVAYSRVSKNYDKSNVYFYTYHVRTIIYLGVVLLFQRSLFGTFHWNIFTQTLPVILCDLFASLIIHIAISNGKLTVTSPIMAAYPILDVILGVWLLKESISIGQIVIISLICLSIIVLASSQQKSNRAPHPIKGIIFACVYMVLVAISTFFEKNIYVSHFGVYDLYYYKGLVYAFASIYFIIRGFITSTHVKKPNAVILKGCGITPIGNIVYSFALSMGSLSIVAPISSLYTVFTNIISRIYLKEKISWIEKICIYTIVISTIVLITLYM